MKYFNFASKIGGLTVITNCERQFSCPINNPTKIEYEFWKTRYMMFSKRINYLDYKGLQGIYQDFNEPRTYMR
ncbi:MAG TPA: hypothetical protein DCE56_29425 [Cyanobacteria bacterium UBA8553]|nr:hypothetical protein [Cyanobacteria bacterium UBA8553]